MRLTALMLVPLLGCALFRPSREESIAQGERDFEMRWAGHPEDESLLRYGSPSEVIRLANGHHVNSYHHEVAFSTSRGGAYGNIASSSFDASTVFCDRRFEISEDTHAIVHAAIVGSSCDDNR